MKDRFYQLIDKERNIYELANLYPQTRKKVSDYVDILQDPTTGEPIEIVNNEFVGSKTYSVNEEVINFTANDTTSEEWKELNKQFLNYHKSLTVYTLINSAGINNYISLQSGIGTLKDVKVLDVGGGTGHSHSSFFQYPESVEYFLLDPNLRLLHDQFIRLYPKLSFLEMGHILANAEYLPIKDNSFDVVINLSAIDHFDDYKKFIAEAYRVLKPGGKFLVSSHLDIPQSAEDATKTRTKILSPSFLERLARYRYYKKHAVGSDDHTLHLENEKPIESALLEVGFKITKMEIFKRYFYFVAEK